MSRSMNRSLERDDTVPSLIADRGGLLIFLTVAIVYMATLSNNLSIAHDSVLYAMGILSFEPSYHPNHLLYEPFLSGVLGVLAAMGVAPSVPVIESIGALAGAATIAGGYKILVERFGVTPRNAALTAAAAAASFGLWYYSVGIEIYIFPLSCLTWCFYFLLGARGRVTPVVLAASLHASAILLHQTSVLFALVPVLVLLGDRSRAMGARLLLLGVYALVGAVLVIGVYVAAAVGPGGVTDMESFVTWFLGLAARGDYWSPASPKALALAVVGFGRALIGVNFVFLIEPLRDALSAAFGNKHLSDEAFLLHQAPAFLPWLLLAGVTLWGGLCLWIAAALVRVGFRNGCRNSGDLVPLLAWFLPYAAFFTAWDGGNVDFWVNQVFVAWIIAGILIDRMLSARAAMASLGALALGLVLINGVGMILPATNAENDFYTQKTVTLTAPLRPDGVVVMADLWPDQNHIFFHTGLDVITVAQWDGQEPILDAVRRYFDDGRPVYLWPDMDTLPTRSVTLYGQGLIDSVRELREEMCGTEAVSAFEEFEVHQVTCLR